MKPERGGFIGANWKNANMTTARAERWAIEFNGENLKLITKPDLQIVLFPPMSAGYVLRKLLQELPQTKSFGESGSFSFGGQDIAHVVGDKERLTGSHHPRLLRDLGMTYVLAGHSERRIYAGETDEIVKKKLQAAIDSSLTPVLCVGETLEEYEAGKTLDVVSRQLSALDVIPDERRQALTVAYEPVWAIGTGKSATPEIANRVCQFVRKNGRVRRVIYGGSVTAENAGSYFDKEDIDGALLGGSGENPDSFYKIARAAADRL